MTDLAQLNKKVALLGGHPIVLAVDFVCSDLLSSMAKIVMNSDKSLSNQILADDFLSVSSGVSLAATVGVRHEAVPRSSRMRLSVSMEAKHTLPSIRLSMTAYLGHATMGP